MRLFLTSCTTIVLLCGMPRIISAQTRTLRIVTYNIEADINGVTTPLPGLIAPYNDTNNIQAGGVLEGIGEEILGNDPAQPIDVLALQETTSNPLTVTPIVNGLNAFYSNQNIIAVYTNSPYQATESNGNPSTGNGPNAVVYNTTTLQLVASLPVDPPGGVSKLGSSSGEYREVMRYQFAPAGVAVTSTNTFYVYVSHYKSGTGSSNEGYRAGEAAIIRNHAATNLPAGARILFVGDYNVTTSGEVSYQTMLASAAPNGVAQAQGIDPYNVSGATTINWGASTSDPQLLKTLTEHSYDLEYRDDFQVMTTNVYYATGNGFALVPGTYHTFGNNGTTAFYGSVSSTGNTALTNLMAGAFISAATLYLDLTNASDHLPVMADFTILIPAPSISSVKASGKNLVFTVNNAATNGTYVLVMATNLFVPMTNQTAVATNISTGNSFGFTLTNGLNPTAPQRFFRLLYK